MRATLAEPTQQHELPIGRLGALTLQRVATATSIHHRTGPWARCTEDFSRVVRIGTDLRPSAATETPDDAEDVEAPLVLHRRSEPAFA